MLNFYINLRRIDIHKQGISFHVFMSTSKKVLIFLILVFHVSCYFILRNYILFTAVINGAFSFIVLLTGYLYMYCFCVLTFYSTILLNVFIICIIDFLRYSWYITTLSANRDSSIPSFPIVMFLVIFFFKKLRWPIFPTQC